MRGTLAGRAGIGRRYARPAVFAVLVLLAAGTVAPTVFAGQDPRRGGPPGNRLLIRPPDRSGVWTNVAKVVAVGDLHGAYEEFVDILKGTGLVGPDLAWTGGTAHLVQMGDVIDRGPRAKDIYDLIRRLEKEAEAAGGRVHMLIGNHEAMALMGLSFDYQGLVTPEQFVAFVPERIRRRAETEYRRKNGPGADLMKMWTETLPANEGAREAYFEFLRREYGRWIALHDTIIRINDTVFVHGGLSDRYAAWPFDRINETVQGELLSFVGGVPRATRVLFDGQGPLWYRDLALKSEDVMERELDAILDMIKAKALVIAHTPTGGSRTLEPERMSRFGGKVWTIDTGIWDSIGGRTGALIIENGTYRVWGKNDG
jgi:hypothetical protein